jgi:lipooligosaccharide transport system ATP-binding protein
VSAAAPLVHARGLKKAFGSITAVAGIDFDVQPGEAFGFLGPNGAGKSSTMRMVGCVSPPSGGTLRVLGLDPVRDGPSIRARLGVVPQQDTLDNELTVRENIVIYGRYFGLSRREVRTRADRLLDFVQLAERADHRVEPLSGGMKRRLTIARSLVNDPEVMLLDEPTTGLDPQARHVVWDRLYRLKQSGVTLLLTTHYMDEAAQLCDRLVIMHEGRILVEGSPREVIAEHTSPQVIEVFEPPPGAERALAALDGAADRVERLLDRWLLYTSNGDALLRKVRSLPIDPSSVWLRGGTLEDVFLALTGRRLLE